MSDKCFKRVQYRDCNKEFYDELTNLEAQFRNAYTLKALEAQIAEKEADRIAQEVREKLTEKLMTLQDEKLMQEEIKRNYEVSKKREQYKLILQDQIETKVVEKLCKEEEEKKEREVLIEVDKMIDEEYELMKKRNRDILAERLKRERMIFEKMRDIKRTMEIEMEAVATEKDHKYHEKIEKRSIEVKESQKEQMKKREMLIETVAKLFVDGDREKHQRELIISDLIAEEIRQELFIEEYEIEKQVREKKIQLAEDLKEQMMFSVLSEERCHERDRIFAENVMTKIMEDEKLTMLTNEARRRKQIDYKKDLEKLIKDKARVREAAITEYKEEFKAMKLKEEIQRQYVKEARQTLIKEHAENVAKYLKSGILSKEEEEFLTKKKN